MTEKSAISSMRKEKILEYLTDHGNARSYEIAEYIDLRPSRICDYLSELVREDIVVAEGANRNRTYRLKWQGRKPAWLPFCKILKR